MMGQYIESNREFLPKETLTVISVHECYTKAFQLRKEKGEDITDDEIEEIREYEFKMYRSADLILTLTQEDKGILVRFDPSLYGKIEVVPHGVDTDFWYPPKEKRWDTKNILYTGNFDHYPMHKAT
jgi:glycosyltransferase involved in cell wall biosynthesis